MRKLLIAAPWVSACGAAWYALSNWSRLPARMAVTFYGSHVTGWGQKAVSLPFLLTLLFGMLALFTLMLEFPDRLRVRSGPLNDPNEDRRRKLRILFVAHLAVGVILPLALVHVINRNL